MTGTGGTHWIAECYWPGVLDDELLELGHRVVHATSELAGSGGSASYLGSLRVTDDDVVLFLFRGPIGAVRQVTDRAGLRAERILRCVPDLRQPTDLPPTPPDPSPGPTPI
jgi:hypothetical protein